ncbi:alpha/beta hydrolase [Streptomyces sp. NPDC005485]|uniref:alpha/beta hydrolase n=1 Tax=Streptomyces sp. NPDC005485 TaxID=3155591 RepID=UPI0033B7F214
MTLQDNYIFDLDADVTRTSVTYKTRYGITVAADLYRSKDFDESRKHPAIIVGAPFGGVKEQGPGIYAQNMAKRGFIALAFDPSYNGYSGGEPHHVASPDIFVEDFSAAVDYLGTRTFVDRERIGVIGICGSGGFALSAAQADPRIKAVAPVVMYDIHRLTSEGLYGSLTDEARAAALDAAAEQRYAEFEGGAPALTPRGAPLEWDEDTHAIAVEFGEFYSRPRGYHPNAIASFTVTSTPSFMNFPLLSHLPWISPRPILFVAGENAHSRYFSEDAYKLAAEPKELHVVPNAGHVDLYDRTDLIPFGKLDEFFTKNLV